ncbi:MAG TPA: glycosyltransferase family 4 protein [Cytophagales bacterium]|nr:glycosyltransferase family 4 protein [Cytophagales bacterium]
MNLLFITYQGDISGQTNSICFLAKGLAEKGHNVYVGCRRESLLFTLLKDTQVNLLPMVFKGKIDFANIKKIKDAVLKYSIEIINAQSSNDRYSTILSRWLYGLNVKIIHTRRQAPKSVGGFLQNYFYTKGTDKIIAISDELKKTLVKKGLPEDHIHVIYNGTPKERYSMVKEEEIKKLKEKYGLKENDVVIGCISRRKKQEQLIEALPYLDPKIKVMFVGIEKNSLNEYVKNFNVKQEVIYAGLVDAKEVLNYYKLFTISVLPSTMDGFGLVLVEAMALGVPVVATRAEGIINVVEENKSGLLFNDGDIKDLAAKINILLEDNEKRKTLIQNGKVRALDTFSMERTVENYEIFFKSLLSR